MLDLGFVRNNLEVVEEKLRARGADPAALLGDFRALDLARRKAITESEQVNAQINKNSLEIGKFMQLGKQSEPAPGKADRLAEIQQIKNESLVLKIQDDS